MSSLKFFQEHFKTPVSNFNKPKPESKPLPSEINLKMNIWSSTFKINRPGLKLIPLENGNEHVVPNYFQFFNQGNAWSHDHPTAISSLFSRFERGKHTHTFFRISSYPKKLVFFPIRVQNFWFSKHHKSSNHQSYLYFLTITIFNA